MALSELQQQQADALLQALFNKKPGAEGRKQLKLALEGADPSVVTALQKIMPQFRESQRFDDEGNEIKKPGTAFDMSSPSGSSLYAQAILRAQAKQDREGRTSSTPMPITMSGSGGAAGRKKTDDEGFEDDTLAEAEAEEPVEGEDFATEEDTGSGIETGAGAPTSKREGADLLKLRPVPYKRTPGEGLSLQPRPDRQPPRGGLQRPGQRRPPFVPGQSPPLSGGTTPTGGTANPSGGDTTGGATGAPGDPGPGGVTGGPAGTTGGLGGPPPGGPGGPGGFGGPPPGGSGGPPVPPQQPPTTQQAGFPWSTRAQKEASSALGLQGLAKRALQGGATQGVGRAGPPGVAGVAGPAGALREGHTGGEPAYAPGGAMEAMSGGLAGPAGIAEEGEGFVAGPPGGGGVAGSPLAGAMGAQTLRDLLGGGAQAGPALADQAAQEQARDQQNRASRGIPFEDSAGYGPGYGAGEERFFSSEMMGGGPTGLPPIGLPPVRGANQAANQTDQAIESGFFGEPSMTPGAMGGIRDVMDTGGPSVEDYQSFMDMEALGLQPRLTPGQINAMEGVGGGDMVMPDQPLSDQWGNSTLTGQLNPLQELSGAATGMPLDPGPGGGYNPQSDIGGYFGDMPPMTPPSQVGGTIQHGTIRTDPLTGQQTEIPGSTEPFMVSPSTREEFMGGSPELMMKKYYNNPIITPAGPLSGSMSPQTPPVLPNQGTMATPPLNGLAFGAGMMSPDQVAVSSRVPPATGTDITMGSPRRGATAGSWRGMI